MGLKQDIINAKVEGLKAYYPFEETVLDDNNQLVTQFSLKDFSKDSDKLAIRQF